jgi:N-lysine methyltransferase SETD6
MRSIKAIPRGEQIYNTYGDLPNSDLLRRYGYVIPESKDDIVEVPSDFIIETLSNHSKEEIERRVEILDDEEIYEEYIQSEFG